MFVARAPQAEPATHLSSVPPGLRLRDVAYVACRQTGPRRKESSFLLTIDLRDGVEHRALSELPFPRESDEVRALAWLTDDRSQLIAAGTGSSEIYVVDVAAAPARPHFATILQEEAVRSATGCTAPVSLVGLGGSRALVALQRGGSHGHGGLAIYADGQLEPLTHGNDDPASSICQLAVADSTGVAVGLLGDIMNGCTSLIAWGIGTGHIVDECQVSSASSIVLTQDSPNGCEGLVFSTRGELLRWTLSDRRLRSQPSPLPTTPAARLVPASGLVICADPPSVVVSDWLAGVVVSYRLGDVGQVKEVDRLSLVPADDQTENPRWREMIRAHGRRSIGGPLNLTVTPDDATLIVTNGASVELERTYYTTFSSWLTVVQIRDDHLSVDEERTMSMVNRPRGEARYGPVVTCWTAANA